MANGRASGTDWLIRVRTFLMLSYALRRLEESPLHTLAEWMQINRRMGEVWQTLNPWEIPHATPSREAAFYWSSMRG
jgi:hypothetical protein